MCKHTTHTDGFYIWSQNSPTNSPPKSPQLASNDNSPVEIKKKGFEGNENGEMSEGEIDTSVS